MTPDEHELLCDHKRVCNQASKFALEFMAGNLSLDAEIPYAHRLVDVAEALMHDANARRRLVIDRSASALTIDPEPPRRELE